VGLSNGVLGGWRNRKGIAKRTSAGGGGEMGEVCCVLIRGLKKRVMSKDLRGGTSSKVVPSGGLGKNRGAESQ